MNEDYREFANVDDALRWLASPEDEPDLSAIPQQELLRRYREARRAWAALTASWDHAGVPRLSNVTEREYCDRAVSMWWAPITWTSSTSDNIVLDFDAAFLEAGGSGC